MLKPQASFPAPGFNKKKKKAIILYLFCQRFEDVDKDNPFRTNNSILQQKPWVSTSSGV
jgi:hypothetical protein